MWSRYLRMTSKEDVRKVNKWLPPRKSWCGQECLWYLPLSGMAWAFLLSGFGNSLNSLYRAHGWNVPASV